MADEDKEYTVEPAVRKKKSLTLLSKVGIGALVAGSVGFIALPLILPSESTTVETSNAREFQDNDGQSSLANFGVDDTPIGMGLGEELRNADSALADENNNLRSEIARLEEQISQINSGGSEPARNAGVNLDDELQKIKDDNARTLEDFSNKMNDRLSEVMMALDDSRMRQDELINSLGSTTGNGSEQAQLAELERLRQEQIRFQEQQMRSPSVIFDQAGRGGGSGGSIQSENETFGTAGADSGSNRDRDFVSGVASPASRTQAEVIANPSQTVLQGTVIGATLENALDSSLEGSISAMINRPIYSFDGANLVIPAGSRVFGNYSSDIELGQSRILVSWSRIVTPQGQSVQMQAFGGDQQGRSGVTGNVDTRFVERFGGASLVSIINAVPSVVTANISENASIQFDTAESVGNDLSDASSSLISEYASLPPVIRLEPGASVTILVDRDLEFF